MPPLYQQLHLPIEIRREPTLEEYLPGPNAEAVAAISSIATGGGEPFVFLFGENGTGKTHLLQAACIAASGQGLQAQYVPLATPGLEPTVLDRLECQHLVAVDDLHRCVGRPDWEQALFGLFNRMRDAGHHLLMAAHAAPDKLPVDLPDLSSRLLWGPRYRLQPLQDEDCERLLGESAARRGLRIGPEVVRYVMNHAPRDPGSLMTLIDKVDSLSLREQRLPSIALVRRAMEADG